MPVIIYFDKSFIFNTTFSNGMKLFLKLLRLKMAQIIRPFPDDNEQGDQMIWKKLPNFLKSSQIRCQTKECQIKKKHFLKSLFR
jgi:hypothetical protein